MERRGEMEGEMEQRGCRPPAFYLHVLHVGFLPFRKGEKKGAEMRRKEHVEVEGEAED